MSNQCDLDQAGRKQWIESVVGHLWEIYWEPRSSSRESRDSQTVSSVSSSSSSVGTPSIETDEEGDDQSYSADWYDGHIKSYLQHQNKFEIIFVGDEDTVYKMDLKPEYVRPLSQNDDYSMSQNGTTHGNVTQIEGLKSKDLNEPSLNWKIHLVGKDWELFWSASISPNAKEGQIQIQMQKQDYEERSDTDTDCFGADWYEGHVHSYSPKTNTFEVSFTGEDCVYEMTITPDILRPSSKAWIRRTKFILDYEGDRNDNDVGGCQIPHSTATFGELGNVNENFMHTVNKDADGIQQLMKMVEEQILLRDRLTIDSDDTYDGVAGSAPLTLRYVDHLCQCLHLVKKACSWCQSKSTLAQFPQDDNVSSISVSTSSGTEPQLQREAVSRSRPSKLKIDDLYNEILLGFRIFLCLLKMDTDHSKKRRLVKASTSPPRRFKKRRRCNVNAKSDEDNGSESFILDDIIDCESALDPESNRAVWNSISLLLSKKSDNSDSSRSICPSFQQFQELLKLVNGMETRSRCSVRFVSQSMNEVLRLVWDEVMKWIMQVNKLLRCQMLPFQMDTSNNVARKANDSKAMYTLNDVRRTQQLAEKDSLLRRFNLQSYCYDLEEKINEVLLFEGKALSIIGNCASASINHPSNNEAEESIDEIFDDVTIQLRLLRNEMKTVPHVANIEPVGKLTRKIVDDAIMTRKWVICFLRSKVTRERAGLLSSLYNRKPTTDIPIQNLDQMLKQLDAKWIDYNENKSPNIPWESLEYCCEKKCRAMLDTLNKNSILSECEEKLAVLADIIKLKRDVQNIFNSKGQNGVSFDTLQKLFNILNELRKGKAATRKKLTAGLIQNDEVNNKVQEFALEKLAFHLREVEKPFISLYNDGKKWKRTAESFFHSLMTLGNTTISIKVPPLSAKCQMIDTSRIDHLIEKHECGQYCFPSYFQQLSTIKNDISIWVRGLDDIIAPPNISFCPFKCLSNLLNWRQQRPKGLLMHPPRHMVESWIELLVWYRDLFNLLKNQRRDLDHISADAPEMPLFVSSSNDSIDSMILRGRDVINDPTIDFLLKTLDNNNFEKGVDCRKLGGKPISRSKFILQGEQLLRALIQYDKSSRSFGVVASCRMILWERSAISYATKLYNANKQVSSAEAKGLIKTFESISDSEKDDNLYCHIYKRNFIPIQEEVQKVEEIEKEASRIVKSLDDLVDVHPDAVNNYVDLLKAIKTKIKASYNSLRIDMSIENLINQRMKDMSWLVNVSKYPFLFQLDNTDLTQDTMPLSAVKEGTVEFSSGKILWQTLVMICDKLPQRGNKAHKISGVGLEKIMHKVGSSLIKLKSLGEDWDTKVQKKLGLSARGLKRRRRINPFGEGKEDENYTVTTKEIHELANHNILYYVSMPLNSIVQKMYRQSLTIENQFTDLLTCDLSSNNVDRSPMPSIPSLIGPDGNFFLKKLIWDPIYVDMLNKLQKLNNMCDELGTETPETISIKWISRAVQWIESVVSKLKISDKIYLSRKDAEDLAIAGANLFLHIQEITKRSFSRHKIVLYTNRNTRNFSVRMARGGATHSVGGYVLRWIEFCFNGLRGDIFLHRDFLKKVNSFQSLDDMSISSLEALSTLLEKANNDLLIPPDHETIEAIHAIQIKYDWPTTNINTTTVRKTTMEHNPRLRHDLWLNRNREE